MSSPGPSERRWNNDNPNLALRPFYNGKQRAGGDGSTPKDEGLAATAAVAVQPQAFRDISPRELAIRAARSPWLFCEEELLQHLVDRGATSVEVAAAFPHRESSVVFQHYARIIEERFATAPRQAY